MFITLKSYQITIESWFAIPCSITIKITQASNIILYYIILYYIVLYCIVLYIYDDDIYIYMYMIYTYILYTYIYIWICILYIYIYGSKHHHPAIPSHHPAFMTLKILARKRRVFSPPEAADAPSAEPSRSPLRRWSSAGEPLELEDLEDDLSGGRKWCVNKHKYLGIIWVNYHISLNIWVL